jgi:hypothetical protein
MLPDEETQNICAIQKDDNSPILPLTRENLEPLIADNPEAMKYSKKNKLNKALSTYKGN